LGFPVDAFLGEVSFNTPAFRVLSQPTDVVEPFVLLQHLNHCGFGLSDPTALGPCPDYTISMWGDGTVVYRGNSAVRTLGRREHRVSAAAVQELSQSIQSSGFATMEADYSSISAGGYRQTIDHSAEKWLTIRTGTGQKTVHDFYGAPDALVRLESAIERIADSYRYTGLKPGHP